MGRKRWAGTLSWLAINIRSSFWFMPAVLIGCAVVLALGLVELGGQLDVELARYWPRMFGAGAEGSRAMLSAIASSMITVAGVVFSITIVALAQASTQYTSRVLRNFMRDRLNQSVLGVFVGVFVYCLVVLRTIDSGEPGGLPPSLAVFVGLVLAVVAIGFLILFIHHIATSIQAGEIARAVTRDTVEAIDRLFPADAGVAAGPGAPPSQAHDWYPVPATATGYIQSVQPQALVAFAVRHDAVLRMDAGVGEFVVTGQPIAHVARARVPDAAMVEELGGLYAVDAFRTTDQDPAFGVRQLVDVALKALSPGINDTTTAVTCLDYLSALLQRVAQRHIPTPLHSRDGRLRVIARGPDFTAFTALAFAQILENAAGNTAVLLRLLRCIEEVAAVVVDPARCDVLAAQAEVMAEVAADSARTTQARAQLAAAARQALGACHARRDALAPGDARGAGVG